MSTFETLTQGQQAYISGDFDTAQQLFASVLDSPDAHPDVLVNLVASFAATANLDQCLYILEKYKKLVTPDAHLNCAIGAIGAGAMDVARQQLEYALNQSNSGAQISDEVVKHVRACCDWEIPPNSDGEDWRRPTDIFMTLPRVPTTDSDVAIADSILAQRETFFDQRINPAQLAIVNHNLRALEGRGAGKSSVSRWLRGRITDLIERLKPQPDAQEFVLRAEPGTLWRSIPMIKAKKLPARLHKKSIRLPRNVTTYDKRNTSQNWVKKYTRKQRKQQRLRGTGGHQGA